MATQGELDGARRTLDLGRRAKLKGRVDTLEETLATKRDLRETIEKKLSGAYKPPYLVGRDVLEGSAEAAWAPFNVFCIQSGDDDDRKVIGWLKILLRISPVGTPMSQDDERLFHLVQTPRPYVVRLYALRGLNLTPSDDSSGNGNDAYLRCSIGKQKFETRDEAIENDNNPCAACQLAMPHTTLPTRRFCSVRVPSASVRCAQALFPRLRVSDRAAGRRALVHRRPRSRPRLGGLARR